MVTAFWRRKYLIYPRFQLVLTIVNVAIMAGVAIPAIISISRTFKRLRQLGEMSGIAPGNVYYQFVEFQEHLIYSALWVPLLVGILVSVVTTVLLSHRMAGPIVRLRSYFTEIGKTGQFKPIRFRKGDFFSELPEAINGALDKIKSDTGAK